jgi:hypothetical protein
LFSQEVPVLWNCLRPWVKLRARLASRRGGPGRHRVLVLAALEDRTLPTFAAPVAVDLGAAPKAVAVGHLEGNKAPPDVVTANADGSVSVLLGDGHGGLQNPIRIALGTTPVGVAVGDFLGNGFEDVATANLDGTVSVLLSNGNGTFQPARTFPAGGTPAGIAVGDFQGDGRLDIATANRDGTVSVLPGDGKGGFGSAISSQVGGTLTSVAAGEFSGDGKTDLVVGATSSLSVLTSNGDGTFTVKTTVPFFFVYAGLPFPVAVRSVAVSDLRGDGKQDIVALTDSSVSSLLGNGNTPVSVLLGNGDGTFATPVGVNTGGPSVASIVVGDFNGDGKPDLVTSNAAPSSPPGSPTLGFLAGNGNGTFQPVRLTNVGEEASALAAGSFNATGKLDVVFASPDTVAVVAGNGDGTFRTAPSFSANVFPVAIASGDFNGDGKADLVTTGFDDTVAVRLSNGDGTFRPGPTLQVPSFPTSVVVGDFNGDGKADLAVGIGSTIDVFLGNGDGTFRAPRVLNLGSNISIGSLVAADFNHDGKTDLAAAGTLPNSQQTGMVVVFTSNGNGTFRKTASVTVGVIAEGLAAADLNGDGKLDLVTTTFLPDGSRDVKVLLGNGNGTFGKPIATTPGGGATSVAAGDFNGDGKQDLVLLDGRDHTLLVLPGNGNGTFGNPLTYLFDSPPRAMGGPVVADFFGDHKLSVAVVTGTGDVSVLRGNGDGTFQAAVNYLTNFGATQPGALVAADFNGDGKPDLATLGFLSDDVSVLLNTTPGPTVAAPVATTTTLSVPNPAVAGQRLTLTATVTATTGVPAGTVTFFDGGKVLGEVALDPNGQASLLVTLGVGTHALRASFSGLNPFAASTATVREAVTAAATRTALTAEPGFAGTGVVVLTAAVAPVAANSRVPTGTVTFFDGTQVLGTATLYPDGEATLFVYTLTPGKHVLTAVYSGDGTFQGSTSDPVVLTV